MKVEIARLFAAHRSIYGSPGITADLRDAGWRDSQNTVADLLRELGLAARRARSGFERIDALLQQISQTR